MLRQLNHFVCSIDLNSPKDENLNCWFSSQKRLASNLTHTHTLAKRDRACKALILTILSAHARTHAHTHHLTLLQMRSLTPALCLPSIFNGLIKSMASLMNHTMPERERERVGEREEESNGFTGWGERGERMKRRWGRGRRAGTGSSDVSFEAPHKAMKS